MAKSAETNALPEVFRRMRQGLQQMARLITGNKEDAEDALQDAFVRLWVKYPEVPPDVAPALMTTTVRNLSIDRVRRQAEQSVPIDETRDTMADNAAEMQAAADEKYRQVERIIREKLTPLQQDIMKMRDCDGYTYEQIANHFRMQQAAVRMQLSRARQTVRDTWRTQNLSS
ncbi:MAG: sigma-70 family RNA polymerase sigma factor [Bacteroidales bacterium]|nr:sigma-70 family RNA polymerase sigma factor [Bacteroidales bacterium]